MQSLFINNKENEIPEYYSICGEQLKPDEIDINVLNDVLPFIKHSKPDRHLSTFFHFVSSPYLNGVFVELLELHIVVPQFSLAIFTENMSIIFSFALCCFRNCYFLQTYFAIEWHQLSVMMISHRIFIDYAVILAQSLHIT